MPAENTSRGPRRGANPESGMALILAILALLLLTFLGLTLTTTSSTEMQIANNFRWSQQALYNAEAGLEVARTLITSAGALNVLPLRRTAPISWDPAVMSTPQPATPRFPGATRDGENSPCDIRGNGVGYGIVLNTGTGPMENVTNLFGAPLEGAFTIWVRRALDPLGAPGYQVEDDAGVDNFIITVEGVAPSLASPNRATRIIESIATATTPGGVCENPDAAAQASQTGFFAECTPS
jgi:hypothetical protein